MINKKLLYICFLSFFLTNIQSYSQETVLLDVDSVMENNISLLYGDRTINNNIYSVSHVNSDKLSKTISFSLSDALIGRLSGYSSLTSLIRGNSSLNQGPVLILVDGFEQDMTVIDHMDIDEVLSVTVHKDAGSTALFGQRAANGILSIKTKRGNIGKPVIKVKGAYGLFNPIELPEYYDSYDYTGFYNEALQNDGLTSLYSEFNRENYRDGNSDFYPSTDWYKSALKNYGSIGKINFTINGGDKKMKYFVLANYMNKIGLFENTNIHEDYSTQEKVDRFNFRSNFDIQLFKSTAVRADIGGFIYNINSPVASNWQIFDALQTMPPIIAGRYSDWAYGGNSTYQNNPLALISDNGYSKKHYRSINGAFKITQDLNPLLEGLRFNAHLSLYNWAEYADNWSKEFETEYRTEFNEPVVFGFDGDLWHGSWLNQLRNTAGEFYFNYNKNWNDSKVDALLGQRLSQRVAGGKDQTFSNQDYFGKISYSNQDKYFADFVMSYSGSQNFKPGNQYGFFPALSLGWKASDEEFLSDNSAIDLLKFRGSIGLTGSEYVPSQYRFMYLQQYHWNGGYNLGNANDWKGGLVEGQPAYTNAKWENSLKANIGVDLILHKNFNFGLDLYMDKRTDILVTRSGNVPDLIGIDLPLNNLGKVLSRGIEANLSYTYKVSDFTFNIDGYFNYNNSEVLEMNELPRSESYLERTGKPVGQYFGLEKIGFFKDEADIENSPLQMFSVVKPGDVKYKDQNNDGIVDEFDEVAIGRSWAPKVIYAFTPSISYKGVTVEALFDGVAKRSIMLNTSQFWGFYNKRNLASNAVEGRWTEANKSIATVPRLTTMDNSNNYRSNDLWLADGSFLKLRLLEVRYDIPVSFANKMKVQGVQVFFRGNNLLSFDKIDNADPENLGPVPSYSLKSFGINLVF